jgi:hypothetical protein
VAEHEKLAALEDLESAEVEQAREETAKKRNAEIIAQRTEIEDLKSASAKALTESRAGYAQGAAAMRTHLQTEASLRKAQARLNDLTGAKAPIENQFELERKRSLQIASVGLKGINSHPSKFGVLQWPMSLIEWKD